MSDVNVKENIGSLKISEEVIASVAKFAATEIDGVSAVDDNSKSIKGFLEKNFKKDVTVMLSDDIATINLNIAVDYGVNIEKVAASIQSAVKSEVQNMTGVTVSKVNVNVTGVVFTEETSL